MFVNPFALWTEFVLKTGEAMLAAMRTPAGKAGAPRRVAVIPAADPPPAKEQARPPAPKKAKSAPKQAAPKAKAKLKAKPRGRRKR